MTPDDEIPEDDPLAESARRGLRRLADRDATDVVPWSAVNARGRRRKQVRVVGAIAACVVVLGGAGAVIANASGTSDHVSVAGPSETATSSTVPASSTTSSAPTTTTPSAPGGCVGNCGTVALPGTTVGAPTPSAAPGATDFSGTLAVNGDQLVQALSITLGESIDINAYVANITDHLIVTSDSRQPSSLATVCTSKTSGAQSLWWMTNDLLAPGKSTGRGGTFVPTNPYLGTVRCAVDIVTTDQRGTTFDTGAGGDAATAAIVAEVTAIAPITITVQRQLATTTTTTTPATTTTTTP